MCSLKRMSLVPILHSPNSWQKKEKESTERELWIKDLDKPNLKITSKNRYLVLTLKTNV
jgi:hypothetical protein